MSNYKVIILAAGRGKRLGGDIPKVLQTVAGKPLLAHVLATFDDLPREDIVIVVGYKKEDVISEFPGYTYAVQEEQLGTGHAVRCAEAQLDGFDGTVLVCFGDSPMMNRRTLESLVSQHVSSANACTILSGELDEPFGYGRISRTAAGGFVEIIEEKDCTPEQRKITEINSGICAFDSKKLFAALQNLKNSNAQGEYYLTDAPAILASTGGSVGIAKIANNGEHLGVNTPEQLAQIEELLSRR